MSMTIKEFKEKFNFSDMAIEELRRTHYNHKKRNYDKCYLDVYRGAMVFMGEWIIDFNRRICYKEDNDFKHKEMR